MYPIKEILSAAKYHHGCFVNDTAFRICYRDTQNRIWCRAWGRKKKHIPVTTINGRVHLDGLGGMSWTKEGNFFVCEYRTTTLEQRKNDQQQEKFRRSRQAVLSIKQLNQISIEKSPSNREETIVFLNGIRIGTLTENCYTGDVFWYAEKYKGKIGRLHAKYTYSMLYNLCKAFNAYFAQCGTIQIDCTGQYLGYIVVARNDIPEPFVKEQLGKYYWEAGCTHATRWMNRQAARAVAKKLNARTAFARTYLEKIA